MQHIFIFTFSFERTFSQGNQLYFHNDLKALNWTICNDMQNACLWHVYADTFTIQTEMLPVKRFIQQLY